MNPRFFANLALLLLLGTLSILAFQYRDAILQQMQTSLEGLGLGTAGLIFVVTTSLAALVLFPASLLMLFSGAYFGLWWGFFFNMAGFAGGSVLAFLSARYLAHGLVARLLPAAAMRILEQLGTSGWKTVAILRSVGLVPGVLLNYALGVTPIRFSTYVWASLLFSMPNILIITYAGKAGEDFARNGGPGKLLLAVSLIAVASCLTWLLRKRFTAKTV